MYKLVTVQTVKGLSGRIVANDVSRKLTIEPSGDQFLDIIYDFLNEKILTAETKLLHIYANNTSIFFKLKIAARKLICTIIYFAKAKKSQ